jgi:hypothetical protein
MAPGAAELVRFPTMCWSISPRNHDRRHALVAERFRKMETMMIGKLAGALIGRRLAGRHSGVKGAALGYGAAALARRGLGPLGLALGLGWGAKKLYERRLARRGQTFPADANPASPASTTRTPS